MPLDNSWDQNIELLAVDLKIDPLVPEYADKMNFYLTGLDDLERGPGDNPGIGQILCCKTACKTFQIPGVNSAQKFPPWLMR